MEFATDEPGELVGNLLISTVPEPTTLALAGIGSIGLLIRRRRVR